MLLRLLCGLPAALEAEQQVATQTGLCLRLLQGVQLKQLRTWADLPAICRVARDMEALTKQGVNSFKASAVGWREHVDVRSAARLLRLPSLSSAL